MFSQFNCWWCNSEILIQLLTERVYLKWTVRQSWSKNNFICVCSWEKLAFMMQFNIKWEGDNLKI